MTILYLIRHAENDLVGRRLPGRLPDVHLNGRGRSQAEALATLLAEVRFRSVFSSPLERATETAAPLARDQGLRVVERAGLIEMHVGRWQGQSLRSLRRRKLWPTIQHAPSLARFPEGESFPEAQARVVAELEAARRQFPKPKDAVAVVTHADIIKLAIAHYLGLPLDLFQRLVVEPASISVLSILDGGARLLRLNDTRASQAPDSAVDLPEGRARRPSSPGKRR